MAHEDTTFLMTTGIAGLVAFSSLVSPATWALVPVAVASIANPSGMDQAGTEWKSVADDFKKLAEELPKLANSVSEEVWTADDREAFERVVGDFKNELAKAGEMHDGVGTGLENLGKIYHQFAVIVFTVGAILGAFAVAVRIAAMTGVMAGPALVASNAVAGALQKVFQAALKKKMIALTVVGGLLMGIYMWNQSKQNDLRELGMNTDGGGQPAFKQVVDLKLSNVDTNNSGADILRNIGSGTNGSFGAANSPYQVPNAGNGQSGYLPTGQQQGTNGNANVGNGQSGYPVGQQPATNSGTG